ncbi:lipoprotein [Microbacterium sp.]|uniref:LptM family lipoprotein n=1 Tax=Microbacterium sp. TaxID=51671 RepID=UPI0039E60E8E
MKKLWRGASVVVLAAMLSGCAQSAPTDTGAGTGGTTGGAEQAGESSAGGAAETDGGGAGGCAGDLDDDLKPFSSDLVTEPIPDHAVYGDGSEISFTTSLGAGLTPAYELLKFVDGTPTFYTGGFWDDAGDGRYTLALNVFDSDLDGQEGLIEVTAIPDGVTFEDERYEGENVVLGIYCVTFAVEE